MQARLNAISELRMVMARLSIFDENIEIFKIDIIDTSNESLLSQLEAEWVVYQSESAALESRRQKIENGRAARKMCSDSLDLISGWNQSRSLTGAQIDQMVADYADILSALQNNRPDTAKVLVQAKTADGVLVTQEMLDEVEAELTVS